MFFSMVEMSVAKMSIGRNVLGRNVLAEMSEHPTEYQAQCKSGLRYNTSFEIVNLVLGLKMCL